jgi:hypothetical protein
MNSLHYEVDLGPRDSLRVTLAGNAANVLVMDTANFQAFQAGGQHTYYGGYYTRSPAIIRPPSAGHWHVVVNLGGYVGSVNAAVQIVHSN